MIRITVTITEGTDGRAECAILCDDDNRVTPNEKDAGVTLREVITKALYEITRIPDGGSRTVYDDPSPEMLRRIRKRHRMDGDLH